jgi:hypothetical protein
MKERAAKALREAYMSHGYGTVKWADTPYKDYWYSLVESVFLAISKEIEKGRYKPTQYHYTCWASGPVKVRDEWGTEETYRCRSFDGDFNCGYRGCKDGVIKGYLELTAQERHENEMLDKILTLLKGDK